MLESESYHMPRLWTMGANPRGGFFGQGFSVVIPDEATGLRVRFDDRAGLLYVKASGHRAAFGQAQTWLFDYDLRQRRQRERALVDPDVLPRECPETR